MTVILGIDAAWSAKNPSGVALVSGQDGQWRLLAVEPSYEHFFAKAFGGEIPPRPVGSLPDPHKLAKAARLIAGAAVDLVAVDMPMAREPIIGRRVSDNAVSSAYGARGGSTHSPSAFRPGAISAQLVTGFAGLGFPLATTNPQLPGLIEVYPHPALIELLEAPKRLEYKYSRRRSYWRDETSNGRSLNLWRVWREIMRMLEHECTGADTALPDFNFSSATGYEWKAAEDMLDAIVCAVVGICAIEGRASAFGDANSAIWIPKVGSAKPKPQMTITVRTRPF